MSTLLKAALRDLVARQPIAEPCNCIGPQNGQPLCPCQMRNVIVRDGRYVKPEVDLGPVSIAASQEKGE